MGHCGGQVQTCFIVDAGGVSDRAGGNGVQWYDQGMMKPSLMTWQVALTCAEMC